jgi:hypothetical protein
VYADTDRDQSIVVEINKHVDKPDAESTAFFWTDLMSIQDAENPKLERTGTLTAADLPNLDFNTVSVRLLIPPAPWTCPSRIGSCAIFFLLANLGTPLLQPSARLTLRESLSLYAVVCWLVRRPWRRE